MIHYDKRYIALEEQFRQGIDCRLNDTAIDIRFLRFNSTHDLPGTTYNPSRVSKNQPTSSNDQSGAANSQPISPNNQLSFPNGQPGSAKNQPVSLHFGVEEQQISSERASQERVLDKRNKNASTSREDELWTDHQIAENFSFEYPVFLPRGQKRFESCILLLHGLNERSWSKYLPWAEYLCSHTGKPVILFPIAFHINRAPLTWSNPRSLVNLLNFRRDTYSGERSISYANIALSDRISERPERFYLSGRQTWDDLTFLFEEIKTGRHPLFKEGADIDIFAYSIGAFLSQVALMANRKELFSDTRLFMFCGGSIFRSMQGISRSILDKPAFERLQHYYIHVFGKNDTPHERLHLHGKKTNNTFWKRDKAFHSFLQMITPNRFQEERESFFASLGKRIQGIALAKDTVIPYHGIREAMGTTTAESTIQQMDFAYPYTHENPFPVHTKDVSSLNAAFREVFSQAVEFLG